jgi:6-phosphogluconolactonase
MKRTFLLLAALALGACEPEPTAPATDADLLPTLRQQGEDDGDDDDGHRGGVVYALSNATTGNAVLVFARGADGSLAPAGSFATGGLGTGGGLGSQGALILSAGGRYLFAVNAGSNQVSSFRVHDGQLKLVSVVPAGGARPISVTAYDGLLYVLNAGGAGNITGFRIGHRGELTPISNSTRPLSSAASDPAQVEFSPDGRLLIVAEKMTNVLSAYRVQRDGRAIGPIVNASNGMTPFGFAFDRRGHLLVSEAFGGAPDASATSSYDVRRDGTLRVISGSVATTETAACWLVVTRNGRFAYVTNTGSASVSGYRVGRDGSLTLLDADGKTGTTGASPIDAAFSRGSRYLYTLDASSHTITGFRVRSNGSLESLGQTGGLPAGAAGLAAR